MKLDYSLSKSESKLLGCPFYFSRYVLDGVPKPPVGPAAITGTNFHRYREVYVQHLVDTLQARDPEWAYAWLERSGVDEDAYALISRDIETYEIDPDAVYGCELLLAVSEDMQPVRGLVHPGPGKPPLPVPGQPAPYAHGTLDRLDISGSLACISDYKTNRSVSTLYEYEADHYALLVFVNFPAVEAVTFDWEMIRLRDRKCSEYTRSDLPRLIESVRSRVALRQEIADQHEKGLPMHAEPLAGLCSWCTLACPVRAAAMRGEVPCVPVQSESDVQAAAGTLIALKSVVSQIENQLRIYCDEKGDVQLNNGYEVRLKPSITRLYKLRDVLAVLGVDVPEESGRWDVKLNSLKIGATELKNFGKAQCRAGLMDELEMVCQAKTRVELRVGKTKKTEDDD